MLNAAIPSYDDHENIYVPNNTSIFTKQKLQEIEEEIEIYWFVGEILIHFSQFMSDQGDKSMRGYRRLK